VVQNWEGKAGGYAISGFRPRCVIWYSVYRASLRKSMKIFVDYVDGFADAVLRVAVPWSVQTSESAPPRLTIAISIAGHEILKG
jgi:hypothetical protein